MTATAHGQGSQVHLEDVGVQVRGRWVLRHVDLVLEAGMPVALTGASGSGKSLLCTVLAGGLRADEGGIVLDGRPLAEAEPGRIGLVLQSHGLVDGLTVAENVTLPLQARGLPPPEITRRAGAALSDVRLDDESDRLVEELSGGERQRVGVARALAGDPELLVADEPTAELDPENRRRIVRLLLAPRLPPRILVVASDDPEVVEEFPRVVELKGGSATIRPGQAGSPTSPR
jgi:ABC-type lipoprotein export system ATPase subunit